MIKRFYSSGSEICTFPTSIQRFHVEDIDALHFAEDFETLEAGGLVEVGWDGAGFGAGGKEVLFCFDFCRRDDGVSVFQKRKERGSRSRGVRCLG